MQDQHKSIDGRRHIETINLTPCQLDVAVRVLQGLTNRTIAELLGCSEKTVKFHNGHIFKRAKVKTRAELIAQFYFIASEA